jgi:hypothetical protein
MGVASKLHVLQGMRDEQPALGEIGRYPVAPSAKYAWWMELERWVWTLRYDYAHLWPDEGKITDVQRATGQRIRAYRPGWPGCWFQHRGFVENLVAAKAYHTGLLKGAEWAGGPKGWVDWAMFLQESIAVSVGQIREQCESGHVDKAWLYNGDYAQSHNALDARLRADLELPTP